MNELPADEAGFARMEALQREIDGVAELLKKLKAKRTQEEAVCVHAVDAVVDVIVSIGWTSDLID